MVGPVNEVTHLTATLLTLVFALLTSQLYDMAAGERGYSPHCYLTHLGVALITSLLHYSP